MYYSPIHPRTHIKYTYTLPPPPPLPSLSLSLSRLFHCQKLWHFKVRLTVHFVHWVKQTPMSDKITRNAMLCITMTMHYLIPCGGKNSFLPWVTWKTTAMTITSRIKLHMSQTERCSIFGKKCTCTKSSNAAIFYYTSPTFCACLWIGRPRAGNTRCRSVHHNMSKCTPHDVEVYSNQMKGQRVTNCDSPPPHPPPPPYSLSFWVWACCAFTPDLSHVISATVDVSHVTPQGRTARSQRCNNGPRSFLP